MEEGLFKSIKYVSLYEHRLFYGAGELQIGSEIFSEELLRRFVMLIFLNILSAKKGLKICVNAIAK